MYSNSPRTLPLSYNLLNRYSMPYSYNLYDEGRLNKLKVLNNIPVDYDESPFLSLFDDPYEINYRSNLLQRQSVIEEKLVNIPLKLPNLVAEIDKKTEKRNNFNQRDHLSISSQSDQYYVNSDGRLTSLKTINPLKNPSVHEYLHSLSENRDELGYVEKYKEIKHKRNKRLPNASESLKEYKKFKENAGFGFNFLDPMRAKESTEVKIEKVNKRNEYAHYVRERNLAMLNKKNTYDPEPYVKINPLPNLQYSRYINEKKKLL